MVLAFYRFGINWKPLHSPATAFLGPTDKGKSKRRQTPPNRHFPPARKEQHRPVPQEFLKFGVLELSCTPEIKNSDTGRVNAGFRWKPGTQVG